MTTSTSHAQSRRSRVGVASLSRADHADYLALLDLTTSGEGLPVEAAEVLTCPAFRPPLTHGPALCLAALTRRNPRPVGSLFAAHPDWAINHPLCEDNPALSELLERTVFCIYGLAVTPRHRGQGIALALLAEAEEQAHATGYRLATLIHKPELAAFYRHLGYTTARHITITLPHRTFLGVTQLAPFMTAVKPLQTGVEIREVPGARGPVVTGFLPGCDLPPTAYFQDDRVIM